MDYKNHLNMNINSFNFLNKRALIRVDFNVPINNEGQVTDDTRIRMAIPTIKKVLENNGSVVLMSHLGRPKDEFEKKYSLRQIVGTVEKHLGQSISFAEDCISDQAFKLTENLQNGQVVLLENLRFYAEEKKGDSSFAMKLAKHGDVYINDAFGTAHRAHASTAVIANYFKEDKMFGHLLESEIKSVEKVLGSDGHPLTAIVGGAKVSSKITILSNLISKVDHIIIGGGMAYTFVKAVGGKIGKSLVEDDYLSVAKEILNKALENNVKIHLPVDTITAKEFNNKADIFSHAIDVIPDDQMGLDIGKQSISMFSSVIKNSALILWNGPMGVFEMTNFQKGTISIANAVAEATENGAFSLVGGGDSVSAVKKFKLEKDVSYVSTGGGAMLESLEGKILPGISALAK